MIPRFLLFNSVQLVGTIWPTYLISLLGQGVKSSVFLLIYYNYFGSYPASMDEAARIDGAGPIKIFFRIAIPMAKPALIVTYLFRSSGSGTIRCNCPSFRPEPLRRCRCIYNNLRNGLTSYTRLLASAPGAR